MGPTLFFFFFQAEDGIRDDLVTGVQTCALPISSSPQRSAQPHCVVMLVRFARQAVRCVPGQGRERRTRRTRGSAVSAAASPSNHKSGERRGGEECRSRGAADHLKKKKGNGDACV